MEKIEYEGEYEINASKKMLFPYLSTASGLSQWFADDVNINEDKVFVFVWDGEETKAKLVSQRSNSHVKFEFFSKENNEEPNTLELRLEQNEITQSVFIHVKDYSDMVEDEARELWDNLIHDLKEIIGG